MKKLLIACSIAAILFTSGAAVAQPGPGQSRGDISRSDVAAHADQMFARLDQNRDGRVTSLELARAPKPDAKRMPAISKRGAPPPKMTMQDLDRNHDGFITKAEFRANALERFSKHDGKGGGRGRDDPSDAARR